MKHDTLDNLLTIVEDVPVPFNRQLTRSLFPLFVSATSKHENKSYKVHLKRKKPNTNHSITVPPATPSVSAPPVDKCAIESSPWSALKLHDFTIQLIQSRYHWIHLSCTPPLHRDDDPFIIARPGTLGHRLNCVIIAIWLGPKVGIKLGK